MPEKSKAPAKFNERVLLSERSLPDRELLGYVCGFCKQPIAGPNDPYYKALASLREHNIKEHGREFPAPKVTMAYKN